VRGKTTSESLHASLSALVPLPALRPLMNCFVSRGVSALSSVVTVVQRENDKSKRILTSVRAHKIEQAKRR